MRFRKKPVVIEAHRYLGPFSIDEMPEDFQRALLLEPSLNSPDSAVKFYYIKTLEGNHQVTVGDWIIKGIKGEFYSCKPDIFEATYEPADEATT